MKRVQLATTLVFICIPRFALPQCSANGTELRAISRAVDQEDAVTSQRLIADDEKRFPNCTENLLLRGRLLELIGKQEEAEAALRDYVDTAPGDSRGYSALARLYMQEARYARAEAATQAALQRDPFDPIALGLQGEILALRGEADRGISLIERACRLQDNNSENHFQLGKLYSAAGRRLEAVDQFNKVIGFVPGNAQAWDYLAINLEPLGEFDKADQAYVKAEQVNSPGRYFDGFLDYNYGRFLAKQQRLSEAKQHFDLAVSQTPDVRAVWYERARVNLALRDLPAAQLDAERAALLPDERGVILDLQVYTLLEEVYRRSGKTDLAQKYSDLVRQNSAQQAPVAKQP
jgi:tetratricopeptide (TPR) repeat protein